MNESVSVPQMTAQMQKISDYLEEHGKATGEQIENLLGVKRTRIYTLTKKMEALGLICIEGRGKNKVYLSKQ